MREVNTLNDLNNIDFWTPFAGIVFEYLGTKYIYYGKSPQSEAGCVIATPLGSDYYCKLPLEVISCCRELNTDIKITNAETVKEYHLFGHRLNSLSTQSVAGILNTKVVWNDGSSLKNLTNIIKY
jgi:hypothetical protein